MSASLPTAMVPLRGYIPKNFAGLVETSSTKRFIERRPCHAEVVEHVQAVLDPRSAVRYLGEVVPAERLLAVPVERAMVGGDDREDVGGERVPEVLLVLLRPRRRRVDVLGSFEVRLI